MADFTVSSFESVYHPGRYLSSEKGVSRQEHDLDCRLGELRTINQKSSIKPFAITNLHISF